MKIMLKKSSSPSDKKAGLHSLAGRREDIHGEFEKQLSPGRFSMGCHGERPFHLFIFR
ncbi:MAG: hypothetical protein ACM3N7_04015 [Planctomycetaceae bacterium]